MQFGCSTFSFPSVHAMAMRMHVDIKKYIQVMLYTQKMYAQYVDIPWIDYISFS